MEGKEYMNETEINKIIQDEKLDTNLISDGYHTFKELYDHRIALFIVLCNLLYARYILYFKEKDKFPWKSVKHFDGTEWEGWFIAGIGRSKGKQITYHLPIEVWDKLRVVAYDKAPVEWDGHTPADVIERLYKLL